MKKQITILVLAIFAINIGSVYGQATHGNTNPQGITCPVDALNPIAGVPYKYQADINPVSGTAIWHVVYNPATLMASGAWSATDETTSGTFISNATGLGTTTSATSPTSTTITWKSNGLSTVDASHPLIVAIQYAAPSGGCANNLQVFQITPKNAFTLDITNMQPDGSASVTIGTNVSQCYSAISGAIFTAGSPNTVKMDYGTNTMYFEIIAANFTTSFQPSFKLSGLNTGQTADIFWGYTPGTASASIATGVGNGTVGPITATTNVIDTSNGVSIYVKVVIHNGSWEGITTGGDIITLAVEGVNSAGQSDVLADCSIPLPANQFEDTANQTLSARPAINNPTPTPFLTKN